VSRPPPSRGYARPGPATGHGALYRWLHRPGCTTLHFAPDLYVHRPAHQVFPLRKRETEYVSRLQCAVYVKQSPPPIGTWNKCINGSWLSLHRFSRGFWRLKKLSDQNQTASFLPRDAMHKRGLRRHAVSVCLSVCRPSVTFVDHVKTNKHIFEFFSPSGSHTILVFTYQTGWRYSDGNPHPLTGASNAGGVGKNAILDEYLASLQQPYESRTVKNKAATNGGERRALTAASVVRCSHKTTTKCLWRARRYTPERRSNSPRTQHPWS